MNSYGWAKAQPFRSCEHGSVEISKLRRNLESRGLQYMSTKGSILWHYDEKDRVDIHVYEEVLEEPPNNVYLRVRTEHASIKVPWPIGLSHKDVQKLASDPAGNA